MKRAWAIFFGVVEVAIILAIFAAIGRLIYEVSCLGVACLVMLAAAFCAIAKLEALHQRREQEKQNG